MFLHIHVYMTVSYIFGVFLCSKLGMLGNYYQQKKTKVLRNGRLLSPLFPPALGVYVGIPSDLRSKSDQFHHLPGLCSPVTTSSK